MNAQQFGRSGAGYTRLAGSEIHTAAMLRGSPATPNSQSLRFSDRSTNTTARTNFGQSRFASHMTPSPSQRTPIGQQPRSFGGSTSTGTQSGGGAWNRYAPTGGQGTSPIQGAHAFGSTPGTRNVPQSSGDWNRFGSVRSGGAPAPSSSYRGSPYGGTNSGGSNYGSQSGRSQLQVSPPLVRERGNSNNPAPRYSTPSAPHYSAPAAPHYSAPAQHSAPSGGGGHSSGGGGGGHSSGGGGGGHRR